MNGIVRISADTTIGNILGDLLEITSTRPGQLADATGFAAGQVSKWRHGLVIPSAPVLLRLLSGFGYQLALVPLIESGTETAPASTLSDQGAEMHTRLGVDHSNGATGLSGGAAICGHCGEPQRGYASLWGIPLCHPDEGLDCYRLVTVYGHGAPCLTQPCYDPHPTQEAR